MIEKPTDLSERNLPEQVQSLQSHSVTFYNYTESLPIQSGHVSH